ncbi:phosphopentomutase-like isoform X2 [Ptychodera flava]|uniref:phosphopentomutase-like isoform X2 n=1 Tax=Ptychodera flava TaxID=63121 RepID=UPI00396A01C7
MTENITIDTGCVGLDKKVQQWLEWDKNPETRQEMLDLAVKKDVGELKQRLEKRLTFGTAGLRAPMGAGYSRMNDLTVIQSTQGLLRYLEQQFDSLKDKGAVISYDHRYNSKRFAELSACIFLHAGVPVYLFSQITPTPFVPYGVVKYGCAVGIMITPSHNPKGDNGYKVFWDNGAQIIPPHDGGIASCIDNNLSPWSNSWDTSITETSPLCKDPFREVYDDYYKDIQIHCRHRSLNKSSPLKFTYTAMHGVGTEFAINAFDVFGFEPLVLVKEQVDPDPDFPTVKFPNPEEGKSALNLAIKTANENGSTVILANDPDADRCAVAEKQPDGSWKIFTGNETGALFGWWAVLTYREQFGNDVNMSDVYLIASTVSSKILKSIAKQEDCNFVETLTGFKWMGNKTCELQQQGKKVLFAFEEAIGFMYGTQVVDKDGISAAVILAEMASYLASKNITLTQQLDDIFKRYGYHCSENSYYLCYDPDTVKSMFERIRKYEDGKHPSKIGPYSIIGVRDLTTGYDSNQPDNKAILPTSKSSQMITFTFENGCVATLRTSGTEPKIKYYTEICADPSKTDRDAIRRELHDLVKVMVEELMQPAVNNLIAKTD